MKPFVKIIGIFAAGAAIVSGCGKDYLDTAPTDSVSAELAVSNFKNAYASLNGIAQTMCSQQYMGGQGDCGENAVIRLFENYRARTTPTTPSPQVGPRFTIWGSATTSQ